MYVLSIRLGAGSGHIAYTIYTLDKSTLVPKRGRQEHIGKLIREIGA